MDMRASRNFFGRLDLSRIWVCFEILDSVVLGGPNVDSRGLIFFVVLACMAASGPKSERGQSDPQQFRILVPFSGTVNAIWTVGT